MHLYGAVDKAGQTVDFFFSRNRDANATVKKRTWLAQGYGSFLTAWRTFQGIEALHLIRKKGRVRWVAKEDAIAPATFIAELFGIPRNPEIDRTTPNGGSAQRSTEFRNEAFGCRKIMRGSNESDCAARFQRLQLDLAFGRPTIRPDKWKLSVAAFRGSNNYHTYGTRRYRTLTVYSV